MTNDTTMTIEFVFLNQEIHDIDTFLLRFRHKFEVREINKLWQFPEKFLGDP